MKNKQHQAILIIVLAVFVWSGINPKDQFTWLLEVAPAIVGFGFIWYYYKRFKFTTLVYSLIATQDAETCGSESREALRNHRQLRRDEW
jgi:uncharacterized membrane protein YjdF